MLKLIQDKVNAFNTWVAASLPGWKTRIVAGLTVASSAGLLVTQMLTEVPFQWDLLVGKYAPYAGMAIGALTFWFRQLANRAPQSD